MKPFITSLLEEMAAISRARFGSHLDINTKKHATDFVTDVDKQLNQLAIDRIREAFPDDGVVSEEADATSGRSGRAWYIDPVDGTQNFVIGFPLFAHIVACTEGEEILAAGIALPMQQDLYYAERGRGTTKNGKPVHASGHATLMQSTGFISTSWRAERLPTFQKLAEAAKQGRFRASAIGCCGADEVLVASGVHDWVINDGCQDWDYVAGVLLLREAGCTVSKFDGTPWRLGDKELLAANPALHKELVKILN